MNDSEKSRARYPQWERYAWVLAVVWTVVVAASLVWNVVQVRHNTLEAARIQARVAHGKDVIYRRWNAGHGGVYVPLTEVTRPNPYLSDMPERDITTPSGKLLTLMNPAYMTRQVHELAEEEYGVRGHITSLNPIRPENAPDPWETEALQAFERGETEISSVEEMEGEEYMRLMRSLITEKGCLKCHAAQGYQEGDIRGGISVSTPVEPLWAVARMQVLTLAGGHAMLWLMGLGGIVLGTQRLRRSERERKRAEESLRESEGRYRSLIDDVIDTSAVGIFILDKNFQVVWVNQALEQFFGLRRDKVIGRDKRELIRERIKYTFEDPEAFAETVLATYDNNIYVESFECHVLPHGEREERWLEHRSRPIRSGLYAGGRVELYYDITERKRAEEEISRRAEELAALHATSLDITARLELSGLLRSIVRRAAELLGASGGGLYLYRPEQDELELMVSYNLAADYTGIRLKVGEGLSGRVVATGQPLIVNDYRTWEGRASVYEEASFTVGIGVPLRWQERILGVVNVTDLGERQPFDENDLHLLEAFAQQAAVALENARLHEGVRRQLEQLDVLYQVAEAGSRTLELQPLLQGLLDRILAVTGMQIGAIYQLDQNAQQIHLLAHRGLPAEFVTRVKTYVPGQGVTGRALASGQTVVCEDALNVPGLLDKARLARFRSQISLPLKVAGKVIGVLNLNSKEPRTWPPDEMRWLEAVVGQAAIAIENARLFEEIEERRMYLEGVLGAAPDAIVALDARHRIVEWNMGAERLFGYSREEAIGQNIDHLVANPDVFEEAVGFTQIIMGGVEVPPVETVRYRKDGSPVDVILAGSPIMVGDELIGVVVVYTDITARVRMEETLRALALLDELTDLYNRRGFSILAEQQLKMAQRGKRRMVLLFADLDGMKQIRGFQNLKPPGNVV